MILAMLTGTMILGIGVPEDVSPVATHHDTETTMLLHLDKANGTKRM
jgi:hypothetical protein